MPYKFNPFTGRLDYYQSGSAGSGDVVGPASSTDNAIARFDGTTGKLIQNSGVTISDTDVLTAAQIIDSGLTASRVVVSDGSKQLTSSATTSTEIGYVSGVTSAIQTQLDTKAPDTVDYLVYTPNADLPNAVAMAWGNYLQVSGTTTSNLISVLPDFSDSDFKVHDDGDVTKFVRLEISGVSPSTTRTLTVQDANGTIALTANKLSDFAATTSAELAGVISDETGSGALVFANTPTLVTPTLGVASATSVNKVAITAPATSATLTIVDGATLTASASATVSGTNTGDQTITLTGDVTGSGTGSFAATIANDAVTNAKMANMAQSTIKGRAAGAGTGDPTDLTATQATAILDSFTGDSGAGGVKGLVPAPAAGDAAASKFLKADGTWTAPAGSGDVVGPASSTDNAIARYDGTTGKLIQDSVVTIADTTGNMAGVGTLNTHTIQGGTSTFALYSNKLSVFAATTSSELAGVISDETGSGPLVFGTSPTLTTPRFASSGSINDSNGNELVTFLFGASAVNNITVVNASTGLAPTLGVTGDDANISFGISSRGTGSIYFSTDSGVNTGLTVTHAASGVNYVDILEAATTASPVISAAGSDTNINLTIAGKGTGGVVLTATNTGLHILDTNASHDLIVSPGSNLTADRTLTVTTGDADRTLDLGANFTLPADPNADRILFWDDSAGATAYLTPNTGLAISGTNLNANVADLTTQGIVELATAAETTTGTDATRAVTPDGLAGSDYGKRIAIILVSDPGGSAITTGNGKACVRIDSALNGYNLVAVAAALTTVSSSGAVTVMIRRSRRSTATTRTDADMLSTAITIDASEFDTVDAATAAVIDGANDDVNTGDMIYVDIDGAGTGAKGLTIDLTFQLP